MKSREDGEGLGACELRGKAERRLRGVLSMCVHIWVWSEDGQDFLSGAQGQVKRQRAQTEVQEIHLNIRGKKCIPGQMLKQVVVFLSLEVLETGQPGQPAG